MAIAEQLRARATEKEFQAAVVELATGLRWRAYHTFDARRSTKGFPDLVLVKVPTVIFAELKRVGERPRPDQKAWLEALGQCDGVQAYLWTPDDWDFICRVLKEQA